MRLGNFQLESNVFAAPMAGISDLPYRKICRINGAAFTYSEMTSARTELRYSPTSIFRRTAVDESFCAVQIAGSDANQLAEYAQFQYNNGAQLIDINMGCPAKKVCHQAAGSSLLRHEKKVESILRAVVAAVPVAVTLKIRTGWCPQNRNGTKIAKIAEQCGVRALTVHGRTRADKFKGEAEYDTIAAIKQSVKIPIIANGDIIDPTKAKYVLEYTNADAVMIGRAAQGRPWLFNEISHYLKTGDFLAPPSLKKIRDTVLEHLNDLHLHYGETLGVRVARKHISSYLKQLNVTRDRIKTINHASSCQMQQQLITDLFYRLAQGEEPTYDRARLVCHQK
ncbi:MAG TPA: tRNA dihydrouridine synthase DusB [Gammaproteobacteria bacterium]|nr:tRNA dihydrouridine synthase DusB [Gammaproteobacteria bacterium]